MELLRSCLTKRYITFASACGTYVPPKLRTDGRDIGDSHVSGFVHNYTFCSPASPRSSAAKSVEMKTRLAGLSKIGMKGL